MTHSYHEGRPGYSPDQVLHDGCAECASRGANVALGIASLDPQNFARAWSRAADWHREGVYNVSDAEAGLLRAIWSVQLQLERIGWPIGELPCHPHADADPDLARQFTGSGETVDADTPAGMRKLLEERS
jgi:hypothetical protein